MPSTDLRAELEVATEAAWRAGRVTLGYFQTGLVPDLKADQSPVTAADREAEATIRQYLEQAYPEDGILGEEGGEREGRSGRRWVIDPIDGTKSFVQGVPLYGVLIGLEVEGEAAVGAVHLPALDEMVCAARGLGCWWNGRRSNVSKVAVLDQACVCYTSSRSFAEQGRAAALQRIASSVRLLRGWGDCYGHILVATGRAEAMLDPVMNPWDCAPLLPILQEAGGTFTDWQGRATIHGGDAVATNGRLRDAILSSLGS
ncbi:histidinol-phosphatase [Candidatus Latescibacterota bacterium]